MRRKVSTLAILQAAVPHNDPVRVTAAVSGVAGPALISAYYSNLEKPAESGWLDKNVMSIDRFFVFDEQGFHRLRFGAGAITATPATALGVALANSAGPVPLFDAASGTPVSGSVPFTGPAVELELRIYSF